MTILKDKYSISRRQDIAILPFNLKTFMGYLAQVFAVSPDQVTAEFLSTLKPIDIDNYLAFSASYRSDSDVAYNQRHPRKRQRDIIQMLPALRQRN